MPQNKGLQESSPATLLYRGEPIVSRRSFPAIPFLGRWVSFLLDKEQAQTAYCYAVYNYC